MTSKPNRRFSARRMALLAIVAALVTSVVATIFQPGWFRLVYHLPGGDKTGHFLIMGTVTFLVVLAFADARLRGRRLGASGCMLAVGLVVTLDELLQIWLPTRTFSVADLAANWLGILVCGLLAWRVKRRLK